MISIRRAKDEDAQKILELLSQVLLVHHKPRPDLFCEKGGKYTRETLCALMKDDARPIFVATDEEGKVLGHLFCIIEEHAEARDKPRRTLYIDDLCVDEKSRGKKIGELLYKHALQFAKSLACYNVTLHVWEGNDSAKAFYKAMGMKPYMTALEFILDE